MKCFEDLTFCDDFMFCKVMANPEICRGVLEVILGRKIAEAKLVISTQESIQNAYAAKGVRLDVMADDESHTRHNIDYSDFRFIPIFTDIPALHPCFIY